MTVRGRALRGRRDRYCVAATSACGPLSSIALDPSLWQCRQTSSSLEPKLTKPIRLRVLTRLTWAGRASRAVTPARAWPLSGAPVARSTYTPGTLRVIPS